MAIDAVLHVQQLTRYRLISNKTVLDVRHTLPDRVLPKKAQQMMYFVFHAASLSLDSLLDFKHYLIVYFLLSRQKWAGLFHHWATSAECVLQNKPNHPLISNKPPRCHRCQKALTVLLSNTTSQDCILTDTLKTESVLCVKQTSLEGILDVKQTTQVGFLDVISLQTSLIVLCLRNLTKWRHLCQASLTFFWQTNPTDDVLGVKQTLFHSHRENLTKRCP